MPHLLSLPTRGRELDAMNALSAQRLRELAQRWRPPSPLWGGIKGGGPLARLCARMTRLDRLLRPRSSPSSAAALRAQRRQAVHSRWALPATSGRFTRRGTRSQACRPSARVADLPARARRRLHRRQPLRHHRHRARTCRAARRRRRDLLSPPASSRPTTTRTAHGCSGNWSGRRRHAHHRARIATA